MEVLIILEIVPWKPSTVCAFVLPDWMWITCLLYRSGIVPVISCYTHLGNSDTLAAVRIIGKAWTVVYR